MGGLRSLRIRALATLVTCALVIAILPHAGVGQGTVPLANSIVIWGNSALTRENGVVGGSGTQSDPYRIDGWLLEGEAARIHVAGTSAFVVISNITVRAPAFFPTAIELERTHNLRIENVRVELLDPDGEMEQSTYALRLNSPRAVSLRNLSAQGIGALIQNPYETTVEGLSLEGGGLRLDLESGYETKEQIAFGVGNRVNGAPLVVASDAANLTFADMPVGQLIAVNVTNMTLQNLTGAQRPTIIQVQDSNTVSIQRVASSHMQLFGRNVSLRDSAITGRQGLYFWGDGLMVDNVSLTGGGRVNLQSALNVSIHGMQVSTEAGDALSVYGGAYISITQSTFRGAGYGGISMFSAHEVILSGIDVTGSDSSGITAYGWTNWTMRDSRIDAPALGIAAYEGSGLTMTNNTVVNASGGGLWMGRLSNAQLSGNDLGQGGLLIQGTLQEHYASHEIDQTNRITSGPIRYFKDCTGLALENIEGGQVILANCTGASLRNITMRHSAVPLGVAFVQGATLESLTLEGTTSAIQAYAVEGMDLRASRLAGNFSCLQVDAAGGVRVSNNRLAECSRGILLSSTWDSVVENNTIDGAAQAGIWLTNTAHVRVSGNRMEGGGISLAGQFLDAFALADITPDNTVNGLPIVFHRNQSGLIVEGLTLGQLMVVSCPGARVSNVTTSAGWTGALIAYSDEAILRDSTFRDSAAQGVLVWHSQDVVLQNLAAVSFFISSATVDGGRYERNSGDGLRSTSSGALSIRGAAFMNNGGSAVVRSGSSGLFSVEATILEGNGRGLHWDDDSKSQASVSSTRFVNNRGDGIFATGDGSLEVSGSSFVDNGAVGLNSSVRFLEVNGSSFSGNGVGLNITAHSGRNEGIVAYNTFENNAVGARVVASASVRIHHNQFLNNTVQALADAGTTRWDNGFPHGGNYWSDYDGVDRCTSPTQDICPIADGLGDTPRTIEFDPESAAGAPVADKYPLMQPPVRPPEEPPAGAPPEPAPPLLQFLTTLPGALLVLLVLPGTAAVIVWQRSRRPRRP
jgi:parallel beta-helix repeat protein